MPLVLELRMRHTRESLKASELQRTFVLSRIIELEGWESECHGTHVASHAGSESTRTTS